MRGTASMDMVSHFCGYKGDTNHFRIVNLRSGEVFQGDVKIPAGRYRYETEAYASDPSDLFWLEGDFQISIGHFGDILSHHDEVVDFGMYKLDEAMSEDEEGKREAQNGIDFCEWMLKNKKGK